MGVTKEFDTTEQLNINSNKNKSIWPLPMIGILGWSLKRFQILCWEEPAHLFASLFPSFSFAFDKVLSFLRCYIFHLWDLWLKLFAFKGLCWLKNVQRRKRVVNLRTNKTQWEMNQSTPWEFSGDKRDRGGFQDKIRWGRKLPTLLCARHCCEPSKGALTEKVCISLQLGTLKRSNFTLQNMNLELLFPSFHPSFLFDIFSLLQESHSNRKMNMVKKVSKAVASEILFLWWTKILFF